MLRGLFYKNKALFTAGVDAQSIVVVVELFIYRELYIDRIGSIQKQESTITRINLWVTSF